MEHKTQHAQGFLSTSERYFAEVSGDRRGMQTTFTNAIGQAGGAYSSSVMRYTAIVSGRVAPFFLHMVSRSLGDKSARAAFDMAAKDYAAETGYDPQEEFEKLSMSAEFDLVGATQRSLRNLIAMLKDRTVEYDLSRPLEGATVADDEVFWNIMNHWLGDFIGGFKPGEPGALPFDLTSEQDTHERRTRSLAGVLEGSAGVPTGPAKSIATRIIRLMSLARMGNLAAIAGASLDGTEFVISGLDGDARAKTLAALSAFYNYSVECTRRGVLAEPSAEDYDELAKMRIKAKRAFQSIIAADDVAHYAAVQAGELLLSLALSAAERISKQRLDLSVSQDAYRFFTDFQEANMWLVRQAEEHPEANLSELVAGRKNEMRLEERAKRIEGVFLSELGGAVAELLEAAADKKLAEGMGRLLGEHEEGGLYSDFLVAASLVAYQPKDVLLRLVARN